MVLVMARPWKHPKTGVYWYRKVVPAHLRAAIGKTEIKRSLGTKDPGEARRRYPEMAAKVDAMLLAAQYDKPARLTNRQLYGLLGDWYRAELAAREEDPTDDAFQRDREALVAMLEPDPEDGRPPGPLGHLMIPDPIAAKEAADARIEAAMRPHIDRLLLHHGLFIDTETRRKLALLMAKNAVLLNLRTADRLQGDYRPDPVANRLPSYAPPVTEPPPAGPTFDQLVEGWARETLPTNRVHKTFARYFRLLAAQIGHSEGKRVEKADIIAFKDARLAQASPKTVQTEIDGLRAVFSWAATNQKIESNPASGIRIAALKTAKRRGERARYPYTAEEAARILTAARAETAPDRRWLPWLCALTGARISEVASLTGEDVREEHGVWLIDIGPGRRRKTGSSVRRVPLHPALIAEGFTAYAATKGPGARLFPVNADQNVARWVREKVGITDQTKDPSHAWRHWFEDEGRAAGIPEEIRDALAGHTNASIGRQYGNGYGAYRDPRLMKRLAEAVATIAVPGVG